MDDDLEAGWERERQQALAREARDKALADCDDMLAVLHQRQAARPVEQTPPAAPAQPQPAQRRDWEAERKWIEGIVGRMLANKSAAAVVALAEEVGDDIGALQKRVGALEARLLEAEIRAGQESRIADLERRLAEAEQRAVATGPRLIGGTDAA